jgi:hypothetical protein
MIEMLPGFGPRVVDLSPGNYIVAGDGAGGSWCLAIYPDVAGSRLVSRWRQEWKSDGIGSKFFIALSDPGAFIMEQRMLRGIKSRVETARASNDVERSALHKEVA